MPANHQQKIADRFKDSLEQAQARLTTLEEEAQKVFQEVLDRSKASRKEMSTIINRLNSGEIFDKKTVKQWEGKARHVSADLAHRFEDLRSRAIQYAGVASRDQVDELARDLDKLSRKIDRLLNSKKAALKQ
ncbi:MAG TPA: hypothetical protein VGK67_11860 [Myxococcales bacterium]|jgi:predicted site-specific integrase-resolvase